jgi:FMN reductase
MSSVLVISGSSSTTSKTEKIAEKIARNCQELGHLVAHLRVRDLPARALLAGDSTATEMRRALDAVAAADGVVLATPIYQAAYSGLLKTFIDALPQFGLAGKSVLPVATGGSLAHVLALDYGLRPVIQSLAAGHVAPSVFVLGEQVVTTDADTILDERADILLRNAISDFQLWLTQPVRPIAMPRSA